MADKFQPVLNQSDYSPNTGSMVNRLKGASSMTEALGDLTKIAATGASQYAKIKQEEDLTNVRTQVASAIDPLIQEAYLGSPSFQKQQLDEYAGYLATEQRLPYVEGPEDVSVLDSTIANVQKNISDKLSYLQKAKDQGRMSAFDFDQRLRTITRKYISDNPAYRKEILEVAANRLENEGIVNRLKEDETEFEKQQASADAEVKFIKQELKDLSIPESDFRLPNGALNVNAARLAADRLRRATLAKNALLSDIDTGKKVSEEDRRNYVESGIIPLVGEGLYNDARLKIAGVFQGPPGDFAKQKLQARDIALAEMSSWRTRPELARFIGTQEVKDELAVQEKNLLAFVSAVESFQSGDDANKFLSNQQNMMQNRQSMALMEKFNVPAWRFVTELGNFSNLINSEEGTALKGKLIVAVDNILGSGKLSDNLLFNKSINGTETAAVTVTKSALTNANPADPDSNEFAFKVTGAVAGAILDPNITKTPLDQMKAADDHFAVIGKSEYIDKFIDPNPESIGKELSLMNRYTEQLDSNLQKYFIANPTKNIKLEINPGTGLVYATGGDPDFNATYTSRINNALKAYANLRTQTPKEVWKDFYQEYFPSISQGKTISNKATEYNNPLNLKDDSNEIIKFNSLEASVEAAENRILESVGLRSSKIAAQEHTKNKQLYDKKLISKEEYMNRTSSLNAALKQDIATTKPTIKSIVNAIRPATSRSGDTDISQEQYYEFLSDYLSKVGQPVAPFTPLDLNDQETMAKLIAGMAQIESNTKLDVARVASFLKKSKTGKQKSEEEFRKSPEQKAAEEYSAFEQDMETRFPSRSQ